MCFATLDLHKVILLFRKVSVRRKLQVAYTENSQLKTAVGEVGLMIPLEHVEDEGLVLSVHGVRAA